MEAAGDSGRVLKALQELLNPDSDAGDNEELDKSTTAYATPGHIGTTNESQGRYKERRETDNIWEGREVEETLQVDHEDYRLEPKYEIVFSQNVGAEDVFLSMSGKNPSSTHCHQQIVRISLPEAQIEEVDLKVTDTFLDCSTTEYRLGLHLPNKVFGEKSRARWLADSHTLEVILQLNREYEDMC